MGRKKRPASSMAQQQHNQYQQQQQQQQQQQPPSPYHQQQYNHGNSQGYGGQGGGQGGGHYPPPPGAYNSNPYGQPPPPMMGMPSGYPPPQPFQPPLPPPVSAPLPNANKNTKHSTNSSAPAAKKQKVESYSVKKYRTASNKSFRVIDAFQRYTKNHRMSDATYCQITPPNRGATAQCPSVFSIKIGGSDLSWGRGRNRDIAIDNACRAAFALVAAHGYTDFEVNDDCLTVEPTELYVEAGKGTSNGVGLPPVPVGVPPPLPPGPPVPPTGPYGMNVPPPIMMPGAPRAPPPMMNMPGGIPMPGNIPLPIGVPPPLPMGMGMNRNMNGNAVTLIPQAKSLSSEVAVPSVIQKDSASTGAAASGSGSASVPALNASTSRSPSVIDSKVTSHLSLSLDKKDAKKSTGFASTSDGASGSINRSSITSPGYRKKIKGGLTLLYDAEAKEEDAAASTSGDGGVTALSMEMRRAKLSKYKSVLKECFQKRRAAKKQGIGANA